MASIRRRAAEDRSKLSRWNFSSMPSEYGNETRVSSPYIYCAFYRFPFKSFSFNDASSSPLSLSIYSLIFIAPFFFLPFMENVLERVIFKIIRRKLRWSFRLERLVSCISKRGSFREKLPACLYCFAFFFPLIVYQTFTSTSASRNKFVRRRFVAKVRLDCWAWFREIRESGGRINTRATRTNTIKGREEHERWCTRERKGLWQKHFST